MDKKTEDAKFQKEYTDWMYHFNYHAAEKYFDKTILTNTP